MKIIKRTKGKLYDGKKVLSLKSLRMLVKVGVMFVVQDHKGEDITEKVLKLALHDAEQKKVMSVDWLRQQIKDYEMLNVPS